MKCDKCNTEMMLIHSERKMPDPEDIDYNNLTEGQQADYFAAEDSGDFGDWAVVEKLYKCPKCGSAVYVQEY
jgi:ribosomal protein S27AE